MERKPYFYLEKSPQTFKITVMNFPVSESVQPMKRVSALTQAARLYADSFRGGAMDIRNRIDTIIGSDLAKKLQDLLRRCGTAGEKSRQLANQPNVPDFVKEFRLAIIGNGKVSEIVALFRRQRSEEIS